MMSNLLILPLLLPAICALVLVFIRTHSRLSRIFSIGTMSLTTIISLLLLIYVMQHKPIALDFGGWEAPYGIQFVGDSLSLLMVTTSSFVVTLIMAYGFGSREKRAIRYYLPSFILFLTVGVIGSFLPMDKIKYGVDHVLEDSFNQSAYFNQSILTTDTITKHLSVKVDIDNQTVTIGGTAKGSGMIHPNMATMLGFITTDAKVDSKALNQCLRQTTDHSFNMITVDGDTSTNDMVLCMANGQVNHHSLDENHPEWQKFVYAINYVARYLAQSIAKDGEGATKLVTAKVKGAIDIHEARKIAKSIVSSNLVKTAIHGEDANFGRIVTAMGYASKYIDPNATNVKLCQVSVFKQGMSVAFDEAYLKQQLEADNIVIEATVGEGEGDATAYGCDLSYEYVRINASYRT